jgi:hypothetical protein
MGLQRCKSPNFENFKTKWHFDAGLVAMHKVYYKGEGGGSPTSSSHGESCESVFAHGSSMHQSVPTAH